MVVQVRVLGLALDEAGQHVLLVKPLGEPPGTGRMLPIWIGSLEATSIMVALQGTPVPRPLAHDLMRSLLQGAGAEVERVEVTRIDEGTYYAEITLVDGARHPHRGRATVGCRGARHPRRCADLGGRRRDGRSGHSRHDHGGG